MARRRTSARRKRSAAYSGLRNAQRAPARNGFLVAALLGALVLVNLYVFVWDKKSGVRALKQKAAAVQPGQLSASAQPVKLLSDQVVPATSSDQRQRQVVTGRVGKADTLGKVLRHGGLSATEGDEVIRALAGVFDYKSIRPGQPYRIERGSDGRVVRFELELSKAHVLRAERKPTGELGPIVK